MASALRRISTFPLWLEILVRAAALPLYRIRVRGAELVPRSGPVVLIANHLSYADVIVLQLACPRPLRFVGYEGKESALFFRIIFRLAGVIPISPEHPTEGMRRALRSLASGEVVMVFAEGQISRTGQLQEIKRGFAILARRSGAPVLPAAIDGLWGSVFSFSGGRFLAKLPRLTRTPATVAFGPPMPAESATPAQARQALLDLAADALADRPKLQGNLGREVARALARRAGRVVIVDRTAERRPLTAAQLLAAAAALARRLRNLPEKRVGIALPPGAGAAIANLAALFAGKSPVNLNFSAGPAAVQSCLSTAGVRTVLSAEAMRARFPSFPWPEQTLDLRAELAAAGGRRAIAPWLVAAWILPGGVWADLAGVPREGGEGEAAVLFTSGSAGEPKGVVLTHKNLLSNCEQFASIEICPPRSRFAGCLPLFHSFGFTVTLWYPLLHGHFAATIPSPLDTRRLIDAIREENLTILIGAPTFLRPLLKKARPEELVSLRRVVTGAEPLPDELERGFRESFGLEIYEGYGLTEASPVVSVNVPAPAVTTATANPQLGRKVGTVGRMVPGLSARLIDPDSGAQAQPGASGILWLRGPNVFTGYLGDAQGSASALREGGWLATGDLARFDEDGFLTIVGRLSRFSKIGGEMVPHGALERKVVELFGVDETEGPAVAVVGVPDPARGEALVLLAAVPLDQEEVRSRLRAAGLPNLWLPRELKRVGKIPLLASGKTDLAGCARLARDESA